MKVQIGFLNNNHMTSKIVGMIRKWKEKYRSVIHIFFGSGALRIIILILISGVFILTPTKRSIIDQGMACDQIMKTRGLPEEKIEYLTKITDMYSWRYDIWECKAEIEFQSGYWESSINDYLEADAEGGISIHSRTNLGTAYYEVGQEQTAGEVWQVVLAQDPEQVMLYEKLIPVLKDEEDFSGLESVLERWLEIQSNNPEPTFQLGLLKSMNELDEAVLYFSQAVQLGSDHNEEIEKILDAINIATFYESRSTRLRIIGQALGSIDEWQLAQKAFEDSIKMDPLDAETWALLGEAEQHTNSGSGYSALSKSIKLNPGSILARSLTAIYYRRQAEYEIALSYISDLAVDEPDNYIWQIEWGDVLMEMGYPIDAMRHYQLAVELNSEEAETWAALAKGSVSNNIEVNEIGIPAARKAVILEENNPAYI